MSIVAIVFDFDGVIADTERLHLGAFQEVFADRGWQLNESDYFDRYLGCDDRGLVVTYGRDNGIALQREDVDVLVAAKASAFSRHLGTGDVLFQGAKAAIEGLAATLLDRDRVRSAAPRDCVDSRNGRTARSLSRDRRRRRCRDDASRRRSRT